MPAAFIPSTVNPPPVSLSPACPEVIVEGPRGVQAFGGCLVATVDNRDVPGAWSEWTAAQGVMVVSAGVRQMFRFAGGDHCPLRIV